MQNGNSEKPVQCCSVFTLFSLELIKAGDPDQTWRPHSSHLENASLGLSTCHFFVLPAFRVSASKCPWSLTASLGQGTTFTGGLDVGIQLPPGLSDRVLWQMKRSIFIDSSYQQILIPWGKGCKWADDDISRNIYHRRVGECFLTETLSIYRLCVY